MYKLSDKQLISILSRFFFFFFFFFFCLTGPSQDSENAASLLFTSSVKHPTKEIVYRSKLFCFLCFGALRPTQSVFTHVKTMR